MRLAGVNGDGGRKRNLAVLLREAPLIRLFLVALIGKSDIVTAPTWALECHVL